MNYLEFNNYMHAFRRTMAIDLSLTRSIVNEVGNQRNDLVATFTNASGEDFDFYFPTTENANEITDGRMFHAFVDGQPATYSQGHANMSSFRIFGWDHRLLKPRESCVFDILMWRLPDEVSVGEKPFPIKATDRFQLLVRFYSDSSNILEFPPL